jgi:hypothetical protein
MTPFQAFKKIEKASGRLMLGWVLNNLLGLVSFLTLIYLIWWQWHLSFWGIPALIGGLWLINAYLLPKLFRLLNKPHIESAKSGVLVLATKGIIGEATVQKLADTSVEHWPKVITSSMSAAEFKSKITND